MQMHSEETDVRHVVLCRQSVLASFACCARRTLCSDEMWRHAECFWRGCLRYIDVHIYWRLSRSSFDKQSNIIMQVVAMPSHNVAVCKPVLFYFITTLFQTSMVKSNTSKDKGSFLVVPSQPTSVWLWAAALDLYAISMSSLKHTECHLRAKPENRGVNLCYTSRVIITHCCGALSLTFYRRNSITLICSCDIYIRPGWAHN